MSESIGYAVKSSSGVAGTSGTAKLIYGFSIVNDGAGANTVDIYDGTSNGGTKVFSQTCAQSVNQTISFNGVGIAVNGGCYVNLGTHTTAVTVFYKELV